MDHKKVTTTSDKAYEAYLRGEELRKKLYVSEAAQEYERAIEYDPRFAMAHAHLAWLYRELGRQDDYLREKDKAFEFIDKVRDFERIQINLGFARSEMQPEKEREYAAELLSKYGDTPEAYMYLSSYYWGKADVDSALAANIKLLEIDPQHALAYNMLGYLYYSKGEDEKALEYIDKYSTLAVDQANPHDSYGEILLWLGRYDDALHQFQVADSIKPNLDFVVFHMALTYFAKGMYRDAMGAYLKAGELALNDNRKLDYEIGTAASYIFSDKYDEARQILNEAVKNHSDAPTPHLYLGVIAAWQGRIDDALIELGIIKGILAGSNYGGRDPDKSIGRREQNILEAEIAAARKEYDKAIGLYNEVMGEVRRPQSLNTAQLLADIYTKAGKPDSAAQITIEALKDNPNHRRCLWSLAMAYKAMGNQDAEREVLGRLMVVLKDADKDFAPYVKVKRELSRLEGTVS